MTTPYYFPPSRNFLYFANRRSTFSSLSVSQAWQIWTITSDNEVPYVPISSLSSCCRNEGTVMLKCSVREWSGDADLPINHPGNQIVWFNVPPLSNRGQLKHQSQFLAPHLIWKHQNASAPCVTQKRVWGICSDVCFGSYWVDNEFVRNTWGQRSVTGSSSRDSSAFARQGRTAVER